MNILDRLFPCREAIARYITCCENHPWKFVIGWVGISLFALWGTIRLYKTVDTSLTALLPDHYASVRTLKLIDQESAKFSENIFVEGNDTDEIIAFSERVKTELEKLPEVDRVEIKVEEIINQKFALLTLPTEDLENLRTTIKKRMGETKLKKSGFLISLLDDEPETAQSFSDQRVSLEKIKHDYPFLLIKPGSQSQYFLSLDKKVMNIFVFPEHPNSNFRLTQKFYPLMTQTVARIQTDYPNLKTSFFGPYRKRLDEFHLIQKDINWIGTLSGLAVTLSLIFYFRRLSAVVMVMIPLTVGLLLTMGLSELLIGHLNTLTAFLVGILTGLGVDYCIYLYSRYLDERQQGHTTRASLITTISFTGRASFTSGINTSLVFFSLSFADFKGFSEFGIISGLGLLVCFLVIYLLLPFLIIWFERLGWLKVQSSPTLLGLPWPKLPRFIPDGSRRFPFPRTLIFFALSITGLFFFVAPRLEFEYDFGKLKSDLITYPKETQLLSRFFFGGKESNSAILRMNSRDDIPYVRQAVAEKIAQDQESPTLDRFVAFDDFFPSQETQIERMAIIADIKHMAKPKTLRMLKGKERQEAEELLPFLNVEYFPIEAVSFNLINAFSPRHAQGEKIGSYGLVRGREGMRLKDGRQAMKFAEDVHEFKTARGVFNASSQEIVFADIISLMLKESKLAIFIAFTLLFGMVFMDFGNVRETVLVLFPLCCGLMLTLILMHAFGQKITFYNMVVIPMIIGMGEDNAVHLYHRYVEEGRGSILKCLQTTGQATWMANFTTILGFAGLMFSHHKGLQSMGYLSTAGLCGCLFANSLILPACLQFMEDRGVEKPVCPSPIFPLKSPDA